MAATAAVASAPRLVAKALALAHSGPPPAEEHDTRHVLYITGREEWVNSSANDSEKNAPQTVQGWVIHGSMSMCLGLLSFKSGGSAVRHASSKCFQGPHWLNEEDVRGCTWN